MLDEWSSDADAIDSDEEDGPDLPYDRDDTFTEPESEVFLSPDPFAAEPYAATSRKGSIAEALVVADVIRRGYRVSIPYCADSPYDLLVDRQGKIERVQVKFAQVIEGGIRFPCATSRRVYTSANVDWLAACEPISGRCYYVPAGQLGKGRRSMTLRYEATKRTGAKLASEYLVF